MNIDKIVDASRQSKYYFYPLMFWDFKENAPMFSKLAKLFSENYFNAIYRRDFKDEITTIFLCNIA